MKGIYFNGIPLDSEYVMDIEVHRDTFQFHYIHKPIKERGFKPRAIRPSRVRKIEVKDASK